MNVVGKVGSLISQGVYSVATPFHPFGGAVDVIVVQQQDGSFRSTPWYVRFGKFQGVLKGAEKVVRIDVNGVEANFHMYLDNSGEAYFIQETESSRGSETKDSDGMDVSREDGSDDIDKNLGRLEHSVSDSGVDKLRESESCPNRLERSESDVDRRYYDFQDDQSSVDEFSDFGSTRYEGLDGEHIGESLASDSEVILVSVDGHVLTAPVSASEENTENVQLSTPQFHLGPAEGTEEFNSGDDEWAADYIIKLNASASNAECHNACSENEKEDGRKQVCEDDNSIAHELEVCEGDGEHVCPIQENGHTHRFGGFQETQNDDQISPAGIQRKEVFQSCLELAKLTEQVGSGEFEERSPSPRVQGSNIDSPHSSPVVDQSTGGFLAQCTSPIFDSSSTISVESSVLRVETETTETNVVETVNTEQDDQGDESHLFASSEVLDNGLHDQLPEDHITGNDIAELHNGASSVEMQTSSSTRFEISFCAKELRAGMGLEAAARVFEAHCVSVEDFKSSATSIIKNENLIIRYADRYLTWEKAAPIVLGAAAFGLDLPVEPTDAIPVEQSTSSEQRDGENVLTPSSSRRWRLWPIPFRRVKTIEHTGSTASSEDLFVDTESGVNSTVEPSSSSLISNGSPRKQFIRTNVPTSEQIASLNLKDGQNMVTFSFCTRVLGKQQVDAHIYLWKWNARIVISDVDGTITKSDVLGQFMPLVGKDWSQSGVARLFSAIKENGYQLLFLSARAIVQAYLTRSFLFNLKQDGKTLPNGPVVISPDGLFPSLYREVIRRAPHEFKIACLEDIRKLFPSDYNPFYAGFGNRDTDELSYRKMGIPKGKIFIINPKGEVAINHRIDVKSYTNLHTLVNDMFPPTSLVEQEDYNSWNFWRVPLPDIEI